MRLRDCEFYVELANPPVSAKNAKTPPFTQGGLLTGLVIFLTEPTPPVVAKCAVFPPFFNTWGKGYRILPVNYYCHIKRMEGRPRCTADRRLFIAIYSFLL